MRNIPWIGHQKSIVYVNNARMTTESQKLHLMQYWSHISILGTKDCLNSKSTEEISIRNKDRRLIDLQFVILDILDQVHLTK